MSQELNFSQVSLEARKDIIELQNRINGFLTGQEDEERFKLYRLTRGVYGQRQSGVQMFRTKIPFGRLNTEQLLRLADVAEKYGSNNLHITTRQNIQIHYVKLTDSPKVWTALASVGVTAREACGNTVRNITASPLAGVDPDELFDVSPYVQATFEYFLRNPICQEMGRKIKIAFSSSDQDAAFTYFHDFGFIPRLRTVNGKEERGFKVVIGGGLGAVSMLAPTAYEFLPVDQIIPFMEAGIRIFDRFGEREKRMKARMKFLVKKFGLEGFMDLIQQEWKALKHKTFSIPTDTVPLATIPEQIDVQKPVDQDIYDQWKASNAFEQKQAGFYGVKVRVPLGDISSADARILAPIIKKYAADDFRLSVNQGFILRYVKVENIPALFNGLHQLGLTQPGFDTIRDITACPGTDTCALGVTNSTGLAAQLEEVVAAEYPDLINDPFLKIKISGCMNACGQHMAANIGFHGSSIKRQTLVIPAMQIVLGGGVDLKGKGFIAEKVIKIPTRRVPAAVRLLLDDYAEKSLEGEYFNDYYYRHGKRYFYALLKPLADLESIQESEFKDWGQEENYIQSIGVGECAGVMLDVIGTIIKDAEDRLHEGKAKLELDDFADAIYYAYSTFVIGAKALLLSRDIKCNTHKGIINDFQTHFVTAGVFANLEDFSDLVLQIRKYEPNEAFANDYLKQAEAFLQLVIKTRELQLDASAGADKTVVANYYNA